MTKTDFQPLSAMSRYACQTMIPRAAVALITVTAFIRGLGAQIDQENWSENKGDMFGTVQQEFTPRLDTLDSVQLFSFGGDYWGGGSFTMNIRQGGVNGQIVAASEPTYIVPYYQGTVGFGFVKPVQLVPGDVYALEFVSGPQPFPPPFGTTPANYLGGRFFGSGQFVDRDLIFREGIGLELVPEPSLVLLTAVGLGLLLAHHRWAHALSQRNRIPKRCR